MTIVISRNCNVFFKSESEEEKYVYVGLKSSFFYKNITYVYVHVSVHVVVGMLWHCEGAPRTPFKTCNLRTTKNRE